LRWQWGRGVEQSRVELSGHRPPPLHAPLVLRRGDAQNGEVPALALLAIDREVLVTAALIGLIVAGLVVAWGAVVLYRRERRHGPTDS
jgi:hypothetical protein